MTWLILANTCRIEDFPAIFPRELVHHLSTSWGFVKQFTRLFFSSVKKRRNYTACHFGYEVMLLSLVFERFGLYRYQLIPPRWCWFISNLQSQLPVEFWTVVLKYLFIIKLFGEFSSCTSLSLIDTNFQRRINIIGIYVTSGGRGSRGGHASIHLPLQYCTCSFKILNFGVDFLTRASEKHFCCSFKIFPVLLLHKM